MNEVPNKTYTITSPSWDGSLNTKFVDVISPTTSFSGTDIVVSLAFDDSRAIVMGTLATMTYSLYREKRQVRTLGRISPRGVTKGPMTVAGTMIFSVINQHVVNDIRQEIYRINPAHPLCASGLKRIRMDELPPFDIILTFGNEYGQSAKMVIYGVTITDEAMTFSIEDMFTENVMTYMARDIETMRGPFSPDMSMYIQGGTSLGGGSQLPKYGFSSDNLWNKTLDSYQQRVKALVDKANRDYGSSYNEPDYSGMPNLSASSAENSNDVVEIAVHTEYTTGNTAPYITVAFHSDSRNISRKTDSSGDVSFTVRKKDAASFRLIAQFLPNMVTQVSNLGTLEAMSSKSSYTIKLQDSHIAPFTSPTTIVNTPAVVTTSDLINRIYQSFVTSSSTLIKDVRIALNKVGVDLNAAVKKALNASKDFLGQQFQNLWATSFSPEAITRMKNAVINEIKTKWPKQAAVFGGAVALAIVTEGIAPIAEGVGEGVAVLAQWLKGLKDAGQLLSFAAG